jgi:micrococcal nuclease
MDSRCPSAPWFIFFVLFSFCLFPSSLSSSAPRSFSEAVLAQEVIDGDTIILRSGEHVRYIGIDAPEVQRKVNDRWVHSPEPFAEEAKHFNEHLVMGRRLTLGFDRERRDRYGRLLAYVYTDDLFVNAKLVEEGFARVIIIPPNTRQLELLLKLEREAVRRRRGIWSNGRR